MTNSWTLMFLWGLFLFSVIIAVMSYLRILVILHAIDRGLENPPERKQIHEKLRAYKDWCRDRNRKPIIFYLFAVCVILASLAWLPIPWMIFR